MATKNQSTSKNSESTSPASFSSEGSEFSTSTSSRKDRSGFESARDKIDKVSQATRGMSPVWWVAAPAIVAVGVLGWAWRQSVARENRRRRWMRAAAAGNLLMAGYRTVRGRSRPMARDVKAAGKAARKEAKHLIRDVQKEAGSMF